MHIEGVLLWQRKSKRGVCLCTLSSENIADKGVERLQEPEEERVYCDIGLLNVSKATPIVSPT